jgi:hypothetical protein
VFSRIVVFREPVSPLGLGPKVFGSSLSSTRDYRDREVLALSLQTNSTSGQSLEAFIDDITLKLTTGEELTIDLDP